MLKVFAEDGYTPAVITLDSYHGNRMIHYAKKGDYEKTKEHFDKSYYWSKLAAEQEMIRMRMEMLKEAQDGKPGGGLGGGTGGGTDTGGTDTVPDLDPLGFGSTLLNQPNKVYVTETDITATQGKVSVIEASATFG